MFNWSIIRAGVIKMPEEKMTAEDWKIVFRYADSLRFAVARGNSHKVKLESYEVESIYKFVSLVLDNIEVGGIAKTP